MEDIKIFLQKKKIKGQERLKKDIKILLEKKKWCQYYQERKKKLPDYRRNYYIAHKKL